jgi:GTP-binding protein HflX
MTVSLIGYTNAGKSTLMNALTDAGVLAEDKLFATLDTRTRRWQLPNWGPVLLSDTVGFIRDLPHGLIASFKATLAEARHADLLFHVADASNPNVFQQISSVFAVLEELQMQEKQTLLLLNKIDDPQAAGQLNMLRDRYPNAIPISAKSHLGLDRLAHATSDALSAAFVDVEIEAHVGDGRLMAQLRAHGEVLSSTYRDDRVLIHCRIPNRYLARIVGADAVIRRQWDAKKPVENTENAAAAASNVVAESTSVPAPTLELPDPLSSSD